MKSGLVVCFRSLFRGGQQRWGFNSRELVAESLQLLLRRFKTASRLI